MPDDDLAEFKALGRRRQYRACKVAAAAKAKLTPKDAKLLEKAMASDEVENRGITAWLQKRGITDAEVPGASITSHRRRKCACYADQ